MLQVGEAVTYNSFLVALTAQQGPRSTSLAPEPIYGYLVGLLLREIGRSQELYLHTTTEEHMYI